MDDRLSIMLNRLYRPKNRGWEKVLARHGVELPEVHRAVFMFRMGPDFVDPRVFDAICRAVSRSRKVLRHGNEA